MNIIYSEDTNNNVANIIENLGNLLIEQGDLLCLNFSDLNISYMPINLTINQFYEQVDLIKNFLVKGTIFDNREMIIGLLRLTILYNKVYKIIMFDYFEHKIFNSKYAIEKSKPNYFLSKLEKILPYEHYKLIQKNYFHYINRFGIAFNI